MRTIRTLSQPLVFLALTFALGVAVWAIAPWGDFPLNDDWVYARNSAATAEAGSVSIPFGQYAWSIPQLVLGAVFVELGLGSYVWLRWVGILALLGSTYLVGRIFWSGLTQSGIRIPLLIAFCFYCPLVQTSFSFMTDAPFLFLFLAAFAGCGLFLARRTGTSALVALGFVLLALSQRQFGIVISAALGVCLLFEAFKSPAPVVFPVVLMRAGLSFLIPALAFVALTQFWKSLTQGASAPLDLTLSPVFVLSNAFEILGHLGLLAVPVLFLPFSQEAKRLLSQRWLQAVLVLFFVYGLGHHLRAERLFPFTDNVMSRYGFFGLNLVLLGEREVVLGTGLRGFLTLVSVAGALRILVGFGAAWRQSKWGTLDRLVLVSSVFYFLICCFRKTYFDRYCIPLLPGALLCLLAATVPAFSVRWGKWAAWVGVLASICFSVTLLEDYFRWNEARWKAGQAALALGFKSSEVAGGYEFNGHYNGLTGLLGREGQKTPVILSFSHLPGTFLVKEFPYRSFLSTRLGPGTQSIKLLRAQY
ncbi:MAG: hypothetical protein ACK5QT_03360 [Oligoflexia bacterium]